MKLNDFIVSCFYLVDDVLNLIDRGILVDISTRLISPSSQRQNL